MDYGCNDSRCYFEVKLRANHSTKVTDMLEVGAGTVDDIIGHSDVLVLRPHLGCGQKNEL